MKISDDLAQTFVNELTALHLLEGASISYELQDDWQFILVIVKVAVLENREKTVAFLEAAQDMAEKRFPWRRGDYSWMVNITQGSLVVESIFGGDLNSPASGRI